MSKMVLRRRFVLVVLLSIVCCKLFSQKNDTVYLLNGDRITGELKKYENGLLTLKTEGMSTINIEYDQINTLFSSKHFEIVKKTGFSYFGSIVKSELPGTIGVSISNDTVTEPILEIVEITPIKKRFLKKFSGSFELGVSYYKSTQTAQFTFAGDLKYRGRKDLIELAADYMFSEQDFSDSLIIARKSDISIGYNHFFHGRLWGGFGGKLQQNTELGLDYRLQMGLGAGYDIVHTNPIRLYGLAGLLVNREKPVDSVDANTNFEGLLSFKFTWRQYRNPKIDFSTSIDAYPSFSISGRYRLEYNLSIRYEVFRDFYIGLSLYDDYDSKPIGGGESLNDWSIVASFGYSF